MGNLLKSIEAWIIDAELLGDKRPVSGDNGWKKEPKQEFK